MELLNHPSKYSGTNTPPQRETICVLRVMQINAPKHPNYLMKLFWTAVFWAIEPPRRYTPNLNSKNHVKKSHLTPKCCLPHFSKTEMRMQWLILEQGKSSTLCITSYCAMNATQAQMYRIIILTVIGRFMCSLRYELSWGIFLFLLMYKYLHWDQVWFCSLL